MGEGEEWYRVREGIGREKGTGLMWGRGTTLLQELQTLQCVRGEGCERKESIVREVEGGLK